MDKNEIAIEKMLLGKDDTILEIFFTLRELLITSDERITETIKWGMPSYEYKGILCGLGAFKNHISIWFHKGQLMHDKYGLFQKDSQNKTMSHIKICHLSEINRSALLDYMKVAMFINENTLPQEKAKQKATPTIIEGELLTALKHNSIALKFFNSLTDAQKNAYSNYINSAKQETTRDKRVDRSIERLKKGFKTYY